MVRATNVRFAGGMLYVTLNDGRQVGLPLRKTKWLKWLAHATPRQRKRWTIEPLGDASDEVRPLYWNELDDGIEICHLLSAQSLAE
ncbi:MAG: DUF2442 domain-containing protein [Chloroflexi bacterium]|nr:DUF2442 domain-containing protein [Chloroflexota bacterium]